MCLCDAIDAKDMPKRSSVGMYREIASEEYENRGLHQNDITGIYHPDIVTDVVICKGTVNVISSFKT